MKLIKKLPYWLILIILPFIIFYKSFTGYIITAGDFTGSDLLDLHLPFKYSLHNAITDNKLPFWENNLSMGFPLLAEGQTGVFYPMNLILGLFEPYLALNLSIILVFLIAGLGTYLYARSLSFGRLSALFSAIAFSQSAFFVARIKHLNMIAVAGWFPLAIWSIKRLFDTGKSVYTVFLGIIIALQLLAGHPQMAFFCIFVYLIYFLFELIKALKYPDTANLNLVSAISSLIVSITLGVFLSAVQILPTMELTALTERTSYSFFNASGYPFTLKSLITFISPYYSGNPALGTYNANIYREGIFWENCSYIGLLPFSLFIYAVFKLVRNIKYKGNKRKITLPQTDSDLYFLLTLFLFSLTLMLGASTPLYKIIWENIPGFNLFRFPNRFNLFAVFSMSLLSGYFVEALISKLISLRTRTKTDDPEETKISWPLGRVGTGTLLLAFLVIDLWVFLLVRLNPPSNHPRSLNESIQ